MPDGESRDERLALNQALFRDVNARIQKLGTVFEGASGTESYACECADLGCTARIDLSRAEYEDVRRDARRFFVAPSSDHVFPDVEAIVERGDRYWVVEKLGVAAEVVRERAGSSS
jgi:hypothetical protein